jgi:flagellar protein FlaH
VPRVFSTGNEELDSRLGVGIPHPAVMLFEGPSGSAKTTFAAQVVLGALRSGLRVEYFTTESTPRQLLSQTRNVTIDLTRYYISGKLDIYTAYQPGGPWGPAEAREALGRLTSYLARGPRGDLVVVDSLTPLLQYAGPDAVALLVHASRVAASRGKSVLYTLHEGVVEERAAAVLRAAADLYYRFGLASVGGKPVKVLRVVKARGVPDVVEGSLAFDVDPAFGIKIVPIVVAQS